MNAEATANTAIMGLKTLFLNVERWGLLEVDSKDGTVTFVPMKHAIKAGWQVLN